MADNFIATVKDFEEYENSVINFTMNELLRVLEDAVNQFQATYEAKREEMTKQLMLLPVDVRTALLKNSDLVAKLHTTLSEVLRRMDIDPKPAFRKSVAL